jgi:hypothetical protein|tara:strand:+ start:1122 stop:1328 length:207 start_codon:yes stop_codon:yes gene_type:complete
MGYLEIMDNADKALQEINTHERECALRYQRIEERLKEGSKRFDSIDAKLWSVLVLLVAGIVIPQLLKL